MKQTLFIFLLVIGIQSQANLFAQSKTAHVNTKLLMDTLPSRKNAIIEIQEITKRSEAELLELDKQLQKAYNDELAAQHQDTLERQKLAVAKKMEKKGEEYIKGCDYLQCLHSDSLLED